ncbi:hypothetical protein BGX26_000373, partial [Mortierella sp. AD094]
MPRRRSRNSCVSTSNALVLSSHDERMVQAGIHAATELIKRSKCIERAVTRGIQACGFENRGILKGSPAAMLMLTYDGYVPKGSLCSNLQRIGATEEILRSLLVALVATYTAVA